MSSSLGQGLATTRSKPWPAGGQQCPRLHEESTERAPMLCTHKRWAAPIVAPLDAPRTMNADRGLFLEHSVDDSVSLGRPGVDLLVQHNRIRGFIDQGLGCPDRAVAPGCLLPGCVHRTKGAIHISLVLESGWPHPILGTGEWVAPSNPQSATSELVRRSCGGSLPSTQTG